jgi:hypothetical protein
MNALKKIYFLAFAVIALQANAQTDKATTAKIVDQKNYVFVATTAIPQNATDISKVMANIPGNTGGGAINLSGGDYDLVVTVDSLIAYLPFYGRAYRTSTNIDENGHKFSSKNFTYNATKRKKGGWDILMATKDVKDNVRMTLSLSENGYGTLSINCNDKQSITYNGYIRPSEKKSL